MTYVYALTQPVLWPSHAEAFAILRGLSGKLRLDDRFTLLEHLARRVAARHRAHISDAREFVARRIATHVELVCLEFGLAPDYAYELAVRAYAWLRSLETLPNADLGAVWPNADTWLAIDRGGAWHADLNANFTLTANFSVIAVRTGRYPARGVYAASASHWVHDRIAHHAGQLAKEFGVPMLAPFVKAWLRSALNGFERSNRRAA